MIKMDDRERAILRDLAKRVAEIAAEPDMDRRREEWVEHNSLRSKKPMILIFPEGAWVELLPEESLECTGRGPRALELMLKKRIYTYEQFQDDTVCEKESMVSKHIAVGGWGIEPQRTPIGGERGSWHITPVLNDPSGLKKLTYPEVTHNPETAAQELSDMQELWGDILDVKFVGVKGISYHLMKQYTSLRGLEEAMLDMYTEPNMIHDAMAFFTEGHKRIQKQYVEQNLLSFNNDSSYHNSGGNSYTDELPPPDADPDNVRFCDMWGSAESQEMAQVSPEHHAEFVLQYEKQLLEPFGLNGYGCCEDLTKKLPDVFGIKNIRRISISPWADVEKCAEQMKGDYILSWKPLPSHLVGEFNDEAVRKYIQHAVDAAQANGCVLEMILKDTHTCQHHPERFDRWTQIAREVINEA